VQGGFIQPSIRNTSRRVQNTGLRQVVSILHILKLRPAFREDEYFSNIYNHITFPALNDAEPELYFPHNIAAIFVLTTTTTTGNGTGTMPHLNLGMSGQTGH
jgi:hypothetical protein